MDKKWKEMTATERRQVRYQKWLSPEGVRFQDAEAEEHYRKCVARTIDALEMERVPDRIPCLIIGTFLVPHLYGLTPYEAMYDADKLLDANKRYLNDFKPDFGSGPATIGSGTIPDFVFNDDNLILGAAYWSALVERFLI